MDSINTPPHGQALPGELTKRDLTPQELAGVYAKLKAGFVPPSEEEMTRLVEESVYSIDNLQEFLESLEEDSMPETP